MDPAGIPSGTRNSAFPHESGLVFEKKHAVKVVWTKRRSTNTLNQQEKLWIA